MLVLTRKATESILIGDDIKVTLLSIEGDRVRLGIDAPDSLRIFRPEILTKTIDENKLSLKVDTSLRSLVDFKVAIKRKSKD